MNIKFRIGFLNISTHLLLMIVFSAFFILKMIRAFSQTTVAGGLWNYIQIFFSILGLLFLVLYFNKLICSVPILMMLIYGFLSLINSLVSVQHNNQNALFDYLMIPYALFILVIACCDAANNAINKNVLLTASFYIMAAIFATNMLATGSFTALVGATADVYYILGLMPIVMIQTRRFRFVPMFACGVTVLLSGKRTGIITYAVVVVIYYLYYMLVNRRYLRSFYYFIGLAFAILAFILVFGLINDSFNERLLTRLVRLWELGDSSGRDRLWRASANAMNEATWWQWIVGHGNLSAVALLGNHAHNDFLEVLYDYGIFAFLAYAGFYVGCIIELVKMIRDKYENTVFFIMSISIAFALAMFSFYVIDPTYVTAGMICIGFFLTDYQVKHHPNRSLARL